PPSVPRPTLVPAARATSGPASRPAAAPAPRSSTEDRVSQLVRLIGRRLLALPLMILGVTLLVFVIMSFSPSDPARLALGESASPEALELYRENNGLNDPIWLRYFTFLGGMLRGDLGTTSGNVPVTEVVASAFPITLQLTFLGLAIAIVLSAVLR